MRRFLYSTHVLGTFVVLAAANACSGSGGTGEADTDSGDRDVSADPSAGSHTIEGSAPFGLTQCGFFEATSYANPVGLDLVAQ